MAKLDGRAPYLEVYAPSGADYQFKVDFTVDLTDYTNVVAWIYSKGVGILLPMVIQTNGDAVITIPRSITQDSIPLDTRFTVAGQSIATGLVEQLLEGPVFFDEGRV